MRVNKLNRPYCGLVFEMPVLTFIKEFVSRYYKEDKFTLSQLNWIEYTRDLFSELYHKINEQDFRPGSCGGCL